MDSIASFYSRIPNHNTLSPAQLIPYFVYYCELDSSPVLTKDIKKCFESLRIIPYSNISMYLNKHSNQKNALFIKNTHGYFLCRNTKEQIEKELNIPSPIDITNNLIDISIITSIPNVPYYIKLIAEEMCKCYDVGLYSACFAMMRKLIETLIIEVFEYHKLQFEIKDNQNNFYQLNILIDKYIYSNKWSASINLKNSLKKIKKYGDLSVHNRRFFAKKSDIDDLKDDLRLTIQEIILTIDYPNLSKSFILNKQSN